jgi:hypothetical protein
MSRQKHNPWVRGFSFFLAQAFVVSTVAFD